MVYNSPPGRLSSFLLFPGRCLCCGAHSGSNHQDLCLACKSNLPWQEFACQRCALPLPAASDSPCGECQQKMPHFQRTLAPFCYVAPVDRLINDFKHNDRQASGRALAELFCEWLMPQLDSKTIEKPDYLLPVPLHWSRLWKRGFNQAQWLARDIGKTASIPVIHNGLQRKRAGQAQQALTRQQRQGNLTQAFSVNPKQLEVFKDRHIAVIDDVMTTGTTANRIAKLLRDNGVREVSIWTIARTPKW